MLAHETLQKLLIQLSVCLRPAASIWVEAEKSTFESYGVTAELSDKPESTTLVTIKIPSSEGFFKLFLTLMTSEGQLGRFGSLGLMGCSPCEDHWLVEPLFKFEALPENIWELEEALLENSAASVLDWFKAEMGQIGFEVKYA